MRQSKMVRRPFAGDATPAAKAARTTRSPRNLASTINVCMAASRMSLSGLSKSFLSRCGGMMQFTQPQNRVI